MRDTARRAAAEDAVFRQSARFSGKCAFRLAPEGLFRYTIPVKILPLRRHIRCKEEIPMTDSIRYVGVNDHDVDLFEGQYAVPNGMAYNSYVIL